MKISPTAGLETRSKSRVSLQRFRPAPGKTSDSVSVSPSPSLDNHKQILKAQIELQREMQTYAGTSGIIKGLHDSHRAALREVKGA